MKHSALSFLLALLFIAPSAFAEDRPAPSRELPRATFHLTQDPDVKCLARPANASELVRDAGIRVVSWFGNGNSTTILGAVLREMTRLHGGPFRPLQNFAFEVNAGWRITGQQVYDANLRMAKVIVTEPDNVRLITHEMGHVFGNAPRSRNVNWYRAYNDFVKTPCHHTQYARVSYTRGSRNEEFAEAFAAYLTRPQLLMQSGSACMRAFQFFRTVAFPKADPSCLPKAPPPKPKTTEVPLPRPRPAI